MPPDHPEDVGQICPGWEGTAEEAIQALKDAPWDWKLGDDYLTEEEFQARRAEERDHE